MIISCCINTYKRPKLLKILLNSLERQILKENWDFEVIVVDNDELEQGRIVVESYIKNSKLDIKYYTQPIKNISITRNKGVEMARGEIIMFIDDDGYAVENWIKEMIQCMIDFKADAVFGTVYPYFDEGVSDIFIRGGFFDRLIQKTGEISKYKRTTNCLIKSEVLKSIEGPFDPNDGLTGGEDANLFEKIEKKGAKLVFCKEGIVHDHVPLERANLKWLLQRKFRTGKGFTSIKLKYAKNKLYAGIYYFIKPIIFLLISSVIFILCIPFPVKRTQWLLHMVSNIGHLAAYTNIKYQEYD